MVCVLAAMGAASVGKRSFWGPVGAPARYGAELERGTDWPVVVGAQDRFLLELSLVGSPNRLDLTVALVDCLARVEEDDDLAALLDDVAVLFLPLTVAAEDSQPLGKARRDLCVEK